MRVDDDVLVFWCSGVSLFWCWCEDVLSQNVLLVPSRADDVWGVSFSRLSCHHVVSHSRRHVAGTLSRDHIVISSCTPALLHSRSSRTHASSCALLNQVLRIPVEDHCPPLFAEFVYACEAAARWMKLDNRNVVAIHCKGGKGRTGLVIGGLLMWTGHRRCADDASARSQTAHLLSKVWR